METTGIWWRKMAFPLFFVQSLYPNLVRNTPWVFVAQWVQASLTSSRSLVQIQVKTRFFSFFLLFLINFWCILHMYQTLQIIYDIKKLRIENEKKRKKIGLTWIWTHDHQIQRQMHWPLHQMVKWLKQSKYHTCLITTLF